jgi:ubiquinone/menaquinone biosynthesis C-methylase UbiE
MDPLASQTAFWNAAAASKQFTHPLDAERFKRSVAVDTPILDYGCGQGRLCHELSQLGYRNIRGADSSSEMLRLAQAHLPHVEFTLVDGERLPYPDASIGAVLLFAVLTCIPADDAQRQLIAEIARVLQPNGLLLVSDYPLQSDARNRQRYDSFAVELGLGAFRLPGGGVVRHHREAWFAELLAGFHIDDRVEVHGMTMNGNPARLMQFWTRRRAARDAHE